MPLPQWAKDSGERSLKFNRGNHKCFISEDVSIPNSNEFKLQDSMLLYNRTTMLASKYHLTFVLFT